MSKHFRESLWIGTSKEYGWLVFLEYVGNHAYCDYCGLLGILSAYARRNMWSKESR